MKCTRPSLLLEAEEEEGENLWDDVLVPDMRAVVVTFLDPLARWMLALTSTSNLRLVGPDEVKSYPLAKKWVWESSVPHIYLDFDARPWMGGWGSLLGAYGSKEQIETYLPTVLLRKTTGTNVQTPPSAGFFLWRGAIIHHRLNLLQWLHESMLVPLTQYFLAKALEWALRVSDQAILRWIHGLISDRNFEQFVTANPFCLVLAHATQDLPMLEAVQSMFRSFPRTPYLGIAIVLGHMESAWWFVKQHQGSPWKFPLRTVFSPFDDDCDNLGWHVSPTHDIMPQAEKTLNWLRDCKILTHSALKGALEMRPGCPRINLSDRVKEWCETSFPGVLEQWEKDACILFTT